MNRLILVIILLLPLAAEIARVYFIMPFPGSQKSNSIDFAYWLGRNIGWLRIVLLALMAYPLVKTLRIGKRWQKISLFLVIALWCVIFFFFNFRFEADKMFYQPSHKNFAAAVSAGADSVLVIGVSIDGAAKAFPIQIIGYHHQVVDTIGSVPVMVTYCTVCRTGRVFSPVVNGQPESFRLVGMDHFNAMFEDASTKSWWQQATGMAIAGPLKGQSLAEIPSQQLTLEAWTRLHPATLVLQPDSLYKKDYEDLAGYNKGTIKGSLEKRDSASWHFKSWVIGVVHNKTAKAYDWNELVKKEIIQDSLPGLPLLIALENDSASFHAWSRQVNGQSLHFEKNRVQNALNDSNTGSVWNMNGECTEGPLKGSRLTTVPAYQEFWHSWQQFHPGTAAHK
jgi:Protein of unknown function (DUF3179)